MCFAGYRPAHEVAHGSLRLSLCEWNTEEEVDIILQGGAPCGGVPAQYESHVERSVSGKKPFML